MPRFPYAVLPFALLIPSACKDGGGSGPIEASPASLDFGSVDFQGPPINCDPDEGGCAPTALDLTNLSGAAISLSAPQGYDGEHLCLDGFEPDGALSFGDLASGSTYRVTVSVCGYGAGERDTEVSGELRFAADGEAALSVPWSFTPVRALTGDDTAP